MKDYEGYINVLLIFFEIIFNLNNLQLSLQQSPFTNVI